MRKLLLLAPTKKNTTAFSWKTRGSQNLCNAAVRLACKTVVLPEVRVSIALANSKMASEKHNSFASLAGYRAGGAIDLLPTKSIRNSSGQTTYSCTHYLHTHVPLDSASTI
jgi:hypothetical protein